MSAFCVSVSQSRSTGLVDSRAGDLAGPRTSARGYAYASPTGSSTVSSSATGLGFEGWEIGAGTDTQNADIQYDDDVLALSSSAAGPYVLKVMIPQAASALETAGFWANLDYDNLSAISGAVDQLDDLTNLSITSANTSQIRRLTRASGSATVDLFFVTTEDSTGVAAGTGLTADFDFSSRS